MTISAKHAYAPKTLRVTLAFKLAVFLLLPLGYALMSVGQAHADTAPMWKFEGVRVYEYAPDNSHVTYSHADSSVFAHWDNKSYDEKTKVSRGCSFDQRRTWDGPPEQIGVGHEPDACISFEDGYNGFSGNLDGVGTNTPWYWSGNVRLELGVYDPKKTTADDLFDSYGQRCANLTTGDIQFQEFWELGLSGYHSLEDVTYEREPSEMDGINDKTKEAKEKFFAQHPSCSRTYKCHAEDGLSKMLAQYESDYGRMAEAYLSECRDQKNNPVAIDKPMIGMTINISTPLIDDSGEINVVYLYSWDPSNSGTSGATSSPPKENIVINTDASKEGGENDGWVIPAAIVGAVAVVGGAVALGLRGRRKGGGETDPDSDGGQQDKEPQSTFRMQLYKEFGDTLFVGENAETVGARIDELRADGTVLDRPDLTAHITFSVSENLDAQAIGIKGRYQCLNVRAIRADAPSAIVAITFTGEGGTFTNNVKFKVASRDAEIVFPQENLGLPAGKLKYVKRRADADSRIGDGTYTLPFFVKDMPEGYSVSVSLKAIGASDLKGRYVKSEPGRPLPYDVTAEPDGEYGDKGIYNAVIREVADYELDAGVSEGFVLRAVAEIGKPGDDDYKMAVGELPLYRIHLGLAFDVESKSIPCYVVPKPGAENKERDQITGADLQIAYANASLMLFLCDERDMSIIRIAVSPDEDPANPGRPKPLKVTPTKVENDRYCKVGDANESHQQICDDLGITAFGTGVLHDNGAHRIKICATAGFLDVPTRMLADIEISASFEGNVYTATTQVLLLSQPFRVAKNSEEDRAFLERDKYVSDQLVRISTKIEHDYSYHLFSLDNMITRMLDGYDPRFGYDAGQVQTVMDMWVGFLEGSFAGANGTPKGVTFADELKATYAFMQGLRDNTGFLGRVAMGVMSLGISEYVFTTMTLAEKMEAAVFSCKGDKDFGFWDGVEMGVTEFGKQILLEIAVGGAMKKIGNLKAGRAKVEFGKITEEVDVTVAERLFNWGQQYRAAMDGANGLLRENVGLYRAADDALQGCKNFFNSSAGVAKAGIDETVRSADDAMAKGEQLMWKAEKDLSPSGLKARRDFETGMERGRANVERLQKAQQKLEAATDPTAFEEARAAYRRVADEVWADKFSLKTLQRIRGGNAPRLRAQFNRYRETLLDEVQAEALADIARETSIPRENLYVVNASSGSKAAYAQGKRVPSDRDISFKQKVLSDRTRDLTIDQGMGERAVARRLYKKMHGEEAETIEQAMEFMSDMDVTYVNPEKYADGGHVFEHNLEAYEDLSGMLGIKPDGTVDKSLMKDDLHNLQINRASVEHKGVEWFDKSRRSADAASAVEAEAASLSGEARTALFERADALMRTAQSQKVEGVYQITKQVEGVIMPRGVLRSGKCPLTAEAMTIHQQALRVANCEVSPAAFERFLQSNYGLDLNGYAKYMAKFLD